MFRVSCEQTDVPTALQTLQNWLVMSGQPCGDGEYPSSLSQSLIQEGLKGGDSKWVSQEGE